MRLIARMLAEEVGCTVIGEAETGEQGIRLAMRQHPDVVVMDYRLPGMDGVEASRHILAARPGVTVIGWSTSDDALVGEAFLAAGARASASKDDFGGPRAALRGAEVSSRAPRR